MLQMVMERAVLLQVTSTQHVSYIEKEDLLEVPTCTYISLISIMVLYSPTFGIYGMMTVKCVLDYTLYVCPWECL